MKKAALLLTLAGSAALHPAATTPALAVDPAMHSSASVGSTKYGVWGDSFTCSTCHKSTLSGGNAKGVSDTVQNRTVVLNSYQGYGTDSAHTTSAQICEVCHTKTTHHRYDNSSNGTNHNGTVDCTTCHLHNNGFASESPGGIACDGCHADLYLNSSGYGMHSKTAGVSYKHFMQNASVTQQPNVSGGQVGKSWYSTDIPNGSVDNGTIGSPNARRCLMCHVDHDQFRYNNRRAYNLRPNVTVLPAPINGGMNRDDNLCLSCHNTEKTKAVLGPNGETTVMPIPYPNIAYRNATTVLNNSTHGYEVSTTYSDGSTFKAVCAKCHNDSIGRNGESPKSLVNGQKGTTKFGEHNSTVPGRFAILGNTFFQRDPRTTTLSLYSSATNRTVTVSVGGVSPGWVADMHQGHYLVVTGGPGANKRALVTTNTDNTLTLQRWPVGIDGTSTFDIVDDDIPMDNICLSCHCKDGEMKTSGSNDWYGQKSMSDTLQSLFDIFVGDSGTMPSSVNRKSSVTVNLKSGNWNTTSGSPTNIVGYNLKMPGGKRSVTGITAGPTASGSGYNYTLSLNSYITSASGNVELLKPATHPLDMNARHESDERVTAQPGWNKGDQGVTTGANIVTGGSTQISDSTKLWSGAEFNGMTITFPNLFDSTGRPITATVNGGGAGQVNFTPAVAGLNTTNFGDNYYIGNRHVSCADCHNTHASFRNPEGKPSTTSGNTTLTDTTHANVPGWYDDIWAGRLLRVRSSTGIEQVRFVVGFVNATGQYTVSVPWTTNPDSSYTYEIMMGDQWTLAGQSGGRSGSGSSGVSGVIPTSWRVPSAAAGFNNMTTPFAYRKIENVFDNVGTILMGDPQAGQRDLCIKCHSSYAYGNNPPATPSGKPLGVAGRSTDVSKEFNPNNMAHHAVYARGKNQPIVIGNTAKFKGTVGTSSTTTVIYGSGFDSTFVNKALVILSGNGQAQPRLITAQTATTLTLASALSATPAVGSPFVVLDAFNPNWPVFTTGTVNVSSGLATLTGGTLPKTTLPGWFFYTYSDNTWREVRTIKTNTTTVTFEVTGPDITTSSNFLLTAGLGNAFVPPFGPWSILRCTDCHGSTKTDPVGPHASVNSWLIKDADTMQYYWFTGGADTNVTLINQGLPTTVAKPKAYFCYNCHRRDVYGDKDMKTPANYMQSRQPHGSYLDTDSTLSTLNDTLTKWGVHCRLCHAGDRLGGIHGTNLQSSSTPSGGTNNQGQRFLNGSSWGTSNLGVKRSTTAAAGSCYVTSVSDSTVDACGHSHRTGVAYGSKANYDY